MTSDKEQLRDISSIGKFQNVISFMGDDIFCLICFKFGHIVIPKCHFVDYTSNDII